jgi:hypothetical protein
MSFSKPYEARWLRRRLGLTVMLATDADLEQLSRRLPDGWPLRSTGSRDSGRNQEEMRRPHLLNRAEKPANCELLRGTPAL